jgi:hypothetical protein
MLADAVVKNLARACFSDECSYDFFKDVYMRSVDDPEPMRLAVVTRGDDTGPAMCVWALRPFSETFSLGFLYGGDVMFKPTICVYVAQAALAKNAPGRSGLVAKIMDSLMPTLRKFGDAIRAKMFAPYMTNSSDAALDDEVYELQLTMCEDARSRIRRVLTKHGVPHSPVVSDAQFANVVDLLVDRDNGYFDAHVTGERSIRLVDRREMQRGCTGTELEVMVSFEAACDARRVAKMRDAYIGEGLVLAPNCDRMRVSQEAVRGDVMFEMAGMPLEFIAMVLPRFARCFEVGKITCPFGAVRSPFAPEMKFEGWGYGFHIASACGDAIADRLARKEAIAAIARVVGMNLERIKAKVWRPSGPMCAKMVDRVERSIREFA